MRRVLLLAALAVCQAQPVSFAQRESAAFAQLESAAFAQREQAHRENNIGVALLEQYHADQAAARFRRALQIDAGLALAQLNLAVALLNVPDLEGARREATSAAERLPRAPQPAYVLGLVAKSENRVADALGAFERVLALDPADVGSRVNRGQILLQERRYDEAIADLRAAVAAEPHNATALYNLGLALTRAGQRERGQQALERFQELREKGYATSIGSAYSEQGRYAAAVATTGVEPELQDAAAPDVRFSAGPRLAGAGPAAPAAEGRGVTGGGSRVAGGGRSEDGRPDSARSLGGRSALFDFDGDGALDILDVGPLGQRLFRNARGRFVDVTREAGLDPRAAGIAALAADYDNDGRPDVLVLRPSGTTLLRNGSGRFTDVTSAAGLAGGTAVAVAAAFADLDHDGDLDLFLPGFAERAPPASPADAAGTLRSPNDFPPAPNRLFRNDGKGAFTEATTGTGLAEVPGRGLAIVPTDYDNRRDLDLLVLDAARGPVLLRNLRDGTFRDVAKEAGLAAGRFTCVAAADVDKDGRTDFFFGTAGGAGALALSDGSERFRLTPVPASGAVAAQFLDYDNDGLLDLVTLTAGGVSVLRNRGKAGWSEAPAASFPGAAHAFVSGDVDGDGDPDLVLRSPSGELRIAWNEGGNRNRALRVALQGRVSNRQGVGAKLELRSGSLYQRLETAAASPSFAPADLLFGLGRRTAADTLRVLWPSGTLQAELEPSLMPAAPLVELDRKPSSCPFLYTWTGNGFEFATDFLGGGEMGYGAGPRQWNTPVPEEYVRLRDDQLVAKDGRYELRVTNELEEALFLDRVKLLALTHPKGTQVFPNEGLLGAPRRPFRLYAVRDARPPSRAWDDRGRDVLARLLRADREYVDGFPLSDLRGYAEEHALTLDLGETEGRTLLLLTGFTDYAFSSDNVAAGQRGVSLRFPSLQVEDEQGRWHTAIENIGIPVGRPQTLVVELEGVWRGPSRRVRIRTNMRVYWDQALFARESERAPAADSLEPVAADLRERGFSAEIAPDGRAPGSYDYARVTRTSAWKVFPGRYTREGDVKELLRDGDDLFVIAQPGDEIALSFDASGLTQSPAGFERTFLLYAFGYSKEMDINSATPDALGPLPFRGMSRYPYAPPEAYPLTPERLAILERYNTRVVRAPIPPLGLALTEGK